ncbi:MAG: tRNA (N6-threonylcarbamoyladenosine(37)-N6)-methyltransferase TrmO [Candidatus Thorarchaeota archaeon]
MPKSRVFKLQPIGILRTPFKSSNAVPIQSIKSDAKGHIELLEEYRDGLESLDGFSHIILLYWFHKAKEPKMLMKPFLDNALHGIFAIRAPTRPNPIGISTVKLVRIEGTRLYFEGADMLDETPLLDIKPFVPDFDNRPLATSGWLDTISHTEDQSFKADDRFERK